MWHFVSPLFLECHVALLAINVNNILSNWQFKDQLKTIFILIWVINKRDVYNLGGRPSVTILPWRHVTLFLPIKTKPVVKFINILWAAFLQILFRQKITKPNRN